MPSKKDYIYFINSSDKLLKTKLEQINFLDEEEYTKELSNQKLVEDITNNVMKALSKNIESIVAQQVGRINRTDNKISNSFISSDDFDTEYSFLDDETKNIISKFQSAGLQIEQKYNSITNNVDIYWIDSVGNKHLMDLNRYKETKDLKGINSSFKVDQSLIDNYNNAKKYFNNINLFSETGGFTTSGLRNPYLSTDEETTDFSNYKVKSNIGFFLDKLNMPRTTLASKADISRGTILANSEEANGLSLLNAFKISKVLGVPMEQLFVFTDEDDENTDITD